MRAFIVVVFVGLATLSVACASPGAPSAPPPKPAGTAKTTAVPPRPVGATAGAVSAPTATGANLLKNPGFELGRDGWTAMGGQNWGAFDIVDAPAHSGLHSARLAVVGLADAPEKAKVFGVFDKNHIRQVFDQ